MQTLNIDLWPCKDTSSLCSKKVAYLSMEVAVDQVLKTYSGGLGFLAGSHLKSTHALKQNVIGISLLWTYGYYTQNRAGNRDMRVDFIQHGYSFLQDTGILLKVNVHDHEVLVKVLLLPPETFETSPIFFLTTDIPENDPISRTITYRLYDSNMSTRIAQSILLGIGGARLIECLKEDVECFHLNEGHGLPVAYELYAKYRKVDEVRKRLVFTTHTPELAGNEEHETNLLHEMGFFGQLSREEGERISLSTNGRLNYTLAALRLSRKANGVSQKHGLVARQMWQGNLGICPIISITNAQNKHYWVDKQLEQAFQQGDEEGLARRKKELKAQLFRLVADQTGKLLDPDVLTIVWARRLAGYKRESLILYELDRFKQLVNREKDPIQVIWAGKPYPEDQGGISTFNYLEKVTQDLPRCAVLIGYDLELSAQLKKGADLWLNTPRLTREASGTSGMTAAMNGTINCSVQDGWVPEFARHGQNGFYLPLPTQPLSQEKQDWEDHLHLLEVVERDIIPMYYAHPDQWRRIMKTAMADIYPAFDSDRMANEYYEKLYTR